MYKSDYFSNNDTDIVEEYYKDNLVFSSKKK